MTTGGDDRVLGQEPTEKVAGPSTISVIGMSLAEAQAARARADELELENARWQLRDDWHGRQALIYERRIGGLCEENARLALVALAYDRASWRAVAVAALGCLLVLAAAWFLGGRL